MGQKLVAYFRVSTRRQEQSGLGLDAQRHDVRQFAERERCEVIAEYTEAESAWRCSLEARPALRQAIAHARAAKAVLIVAKLDRLLRNTTLCAQLKQSGVRFVCCDNPHANELTIDILAAVAADESRRISERTRAAMTAAKRQGRRFGTPANLTNEAAQRGRMLGSQAAREKARIAYEAIVPIATELHAASKSLSQIAAELNARGFVTRRDRPWTPVQVARIINRSLSEVA